MGKVKEIKTKSGICHAYMGELDDNNNPVDKFGNLVSPGVRTCGNSDCCNMAHIIPFIELERLNSYGRTPKQLFADLLKERFTNDQGRDS